MKIYSTPCEAGPNARTHADQVLRRLHAASEPRLHELVTDPASADFIFISNIRPENDQAALRNHPLLRQYLPRCFAFSDAWNMPFLLSGVYANAAKGRDFGRFRSGSYALHHPDFKNPYIEAFDRAAPDDRQPDLLFSFLGRNCHPCRDALFATAFKRKDLLVEDTSRFDAFTHAREGKDPDQRRYADICLRSKFILCPRGVGPSSIRLFEALRLGIAPIIVSDAWKPCAGPDWSRCAIFVNESDIGRVEEIATAHESRWQKMGRAARQVHEDFFSESKYFNYLVKNIQEIARGRTIPERWIAKIWPVQIALHKRRMRKR